MEYRHLIKKQNIYQFESNPLPMIYPVQLNKSTAGWKAHIQFFLMSHNNIPENIRKYVTYGWIVVDCYPGKYYPYRTRLTVDVKLIKYPGQVSKQAADLTMTKLLFNSNVSTPEVQFMCCNIKNLYLGTPMECYEYIRLTIKIIPE